MPITWPDRRTVMRVAKKRGKKMAKLGWNPFRELSKEEIQSCPSFPKSMETCYLNNLYIVMVYWTETFLGRTMHLMVRPNVDEPIRNWYHLQRVKDEIVGPEREAFEWFPKKSELRDSANIYHLWVVPEGMEMGIGI